MRKRFYGCENGMPIEDLDQYFSINKNYCYIKENQEEVDHKHPPKLKKTSSTFRYLTAQTLLLAYFKVL
jgi:hypothetical protein